MRVTLLATELTYAALRKQALSSTDEILKAGDSAPFMAELDRIQTKIDSQGLIKDFLPTLNPSPFPSALFPVLKATQTVDTKSKKLREKIGRGGKAEQVSCDDPSGETEDPQDETMTALLQIASMLKSYQ